MLTVEEALEQILDCCVANKIELSELSDSLGKSLARDVFSPLNLPPFANSAVDGYAVRAADLLSASQTSPVTLRVSFQQNAQGTVPSILPADTAVRIMTGAPLPAGADTVIMQEDVVTCDDGSVQFSSRVREGDHIRHAGSDVALGEPVMAAGTRIGPAESGMLAAMGMSTIQTYAVPRVAVLTTGDEVEEPEENTSLQYGKIFNSNRYCIAALARQLKAHVAITRHLKDDLEDTCSGIQEASAVSEIVVCAGGVSVGQRDFVKSALERVGRMVFWRVSIKPGKPVVFGLVGKALFFGLPGNPASVAVTFELFVRPCLLKLAGRKHLNRPHVDSVLADNIDHEPGRREYVRAVTEWREGQYISTTTGGQGSGRLSSLLCSNSLVIVPEECGAKAPGDRVRVMLTNSDG